MELRPYQRKGVDLFKTNTGFANFCEMGTGKTAMAIVAANEMNFSKVLVVCPKTPIRNWCNEWSQWSTHTWQVVPLVGSLASRKSVLSSELGERYVLVTNYESLIGLAPIISTLGINLIIADEAHAIKNYKAKRTKALKAIPSRFRWILTGTPDPQGPLDYWSLFDFIRPGYFNHSYFAFRARYANFYTGAGFPKLVGYKNLDELKQKVAAFSYRVLKQDCLGLPDKVFQRIEVEMEPAARSAYKDMVRDFLVEIDNEVVTAANSAVKMIRLQQITSGFLQPPDSQPIEIGRHKIDALHEVLEGIEHERVVVFARFTWDVETILKSITKRPAFRLDGQTKDRQGVADAFAASSNGVLVANIQVGGVAINLTCAAYTIYYSRTYSLVDMMQSEDRTHRFGQTRPCTYYDLVCPGTIDMAVIKAVEKKIDLAATMKNETLKRIIVGEDF